MGDRYVEQLEDKIKKSLLPGEFNRQKLLIHELEKKALGASEQASKIMNKILGMKRSGEDFSKEYEDLLGVRK